eukprot:COSAG06_NODE_2904_length_6116_cov_6.924713_1_plen_717_part_00
MMSAHAASPSDRAAAARAARDARSRVGYTGLVARSSSSSSSGAFERPVDPAQPETVRLRPETQPPRPSNGTTEGTAEEEEIVRCCCESIDPEGFGKRLWDALIWLSVLFTLVAVPTRLGFGVPGAVLGDWAPAQIPLDILWVLDIFVEFLTAFNDENMHTIREPGKIATHYARGWLIVDLFAVVPTLWARLDEPGSGSPFVRSGGWGICKVVKLMVNGSFSKAVPRFVNEALKEVLSRRDMDYDNTARHHTMMEVMTNSLLAIDFVIFVHIFGCCWYYVGLSNQRIDDTTVLNGWVHDEGWTPNVGTWTRWLRSFYWAITTITTVGYGDVTAQTCNEMLLTAATMVLGVICNAWVIGAVSNFLARRTLSQDKHDDQVALMRKYMTKKRVPEKLQSQVSHFVENLFEQELEFEIQKFVEDDLPPKLQFELLAFLYIDKIRAVECFEKMPEQILMRLSKIAKPYPMKCGDVIFAPGDVAREVFIIARGKDGNKAMVKLTAFLENEEVEEKSEKRWERDESKTDLVVKDGAIFGIHALDFAPEDVVRDMQAEAMTDGELLLMSADDVEDIASDYQQLEADVTAYRAARESDMTVKTRQHSVAVENWASGSSGSLSLNREGVTTEEYTAMMLQRAVRRWLKRRQIRTGLTKLKYQAELQSKKDKLEDRKHLRKIDDIVQRQHDMQAKQDEMMTDISAIKGLLETLVGQQQQQQQQQQLPL